MVGCGRGGGAAAEESSQTAIVVRVENVAVVATGTLRTGPVISGTLAPIRRTRSSEHRLADRSFRSRPIKENASPIAASWRASTPRDFATPSYRRARNSILPRWRPTTQHVEAQRYDTLFAAGAVSDRDRGSVVQHECTGPSRAERSQFRLVAAEKQVEYTLVRAPFGGVVADRDQVVSVGDVVQPGRLMFTVVDPSPLQLDAWCRPSRSPPCGSGSRWPST